MSVEDQQEVSNLFGTKTIRLIPPFVIAYGLPAGIFMSYMLFLRGYGRRPDGWIFKTIDEAYRETGLTRPNQDTAIKVLKKAGVLHVRRTGPRGKRHFMVDYPKVLELIPSMEESNKQKCRKAAGGIDGNDQTITYNTQVLTGHILSSREQSRMPFVGLHNDQTEPEKADEQMDKSFRDMFKHFRPLKDRDDILEGEIINLNEI